MSRGEGKARLSGPVGRLRGRMSVSMLGMGSRFALSAMDCPSCSSFSLLSCKLPLGISGKRLDIAGSRVGV